MPSFIKKTYCERCGKEVPLFGGQKTAEGYICTPCRKELQPFVEKRKLQFSEITSEIIHEIDDEIKAKKEADKQKENTVTGVMIAFVIIGIAMLWGIGQSSKEPSSAISEGTPVSETAAAEETEKPQFTPQADIKEETISTPEPTSAPDIPDESPISDSDPISEEAVSAGIDEDFKALFAIEFPDEADIRKFANAYAGEEIELDGCAMYAEGDRVVVWYGDYEGQEDISRFGPEMLLLRVPENSCVTGDNIHIVANVLSYRERSSQMYLDCLSIALR